VKSSINDRFRRHLGNLPQQVQRRARAAYQRFLQDPHHKSLQFKLVNEKEQLYSVRIGKSYRALGFMDDNHQIVWFWIGPHSEYDTLLSQF
jgi:mRNA-degrading endonuclease RelE of RelBE toxin-antitoxin system